MKFFPDTFNRIWYRTQSGHDPVPPPEPFNPCRCQLCGSPGSTICPWCNPMEKPMSDVTRPQQDPKPGRTAITPLVIADLEARRQQGIAKYGTELKSSNGRDALQDAYEESLDQCMYLRQELEQRAERVARLVSAQLQQDVDFSAKYDKEIENMMPGCISSSTPLDLTGIEVKPGKIITVDGSPANVTAVWRPHDAESIAQEAHRLVLGDRGAMYGHPMEDFGRTAGMLNALFGTKLNSPLTEEDIAKMMICVKLSREQNKPKRDNIVDLAGYAITLEMVKEERARRESEKA